MLRFLTAGESHGKALVAILEGMPAGVPLTEERVNRELARRQHGYGRGGRMLIEQDAVTLLSGVRHGKTLGSPIAMHIANKDASIDRLPVVTRPRPGHADLVGAIKYNHRDIRNILERASARETTARVAVGACCKQLLAPFGMDIVSHTAAVGRIQAKPAAPSPSLLKRIDTTPLRCADPVAEQQMIALIDAMKKKGDTLGGVFEVVAFGVPLGLGSHTHYDRRLDAIIGAAILSIHAVKAVDIGDGVAAAGRPGSSVQDEIYYSKTRGFYRKSNRSGGFEGGMTTGAPIIVRGYLKPLSTLMQPLRSVDINTKRVIRATVERSDVCTVPAAGVIGEAMVAFELAKAFLDKFGHDHLDELQRNVRHHRKHVASF